MAGGSGVKTNERPGTRAQARYVRVSAYKAREVLDLIRDLHVSDADQVLAFTDRDVAKVVRKVLASAVANGQNNEQQDPDTLKVVACYADEGPTLKRWRPRARGRATRIRKRTCHITVIVGRMGDDELRRWREKNQAGLTTEGGRGGRRRTPAADRRARVARSRGESTEATEAKTVDEDSTDDVTADAAATDEVATSSDPAHHPEGAGSAGTTDTEVTDAEVAVDDAIGSSTDPDTDEAEDVADDAEKDEDK
jgi:large subunit ribosomal protein L22